LVEISGHGYWVGLVVIELWVVAAVDDDSVVVVVIKELVHTVGRRLHI